jgi:20S proteasome subunit alpha 7
VQYDQSVSTFSPNGRVFQVEYAYKAVEKSSTCIGIRCIDGVVLGVEKQILNRMLVPGSNRRIAAVDYHAAIAMSGLAADARQLVNKARSESNEYQQFYGAQITGKVLAERLGGHIHTHTLYWYLRPFGCAILLAVYDDDTDGGPSLYALEPSGNTSKYFACAIGKMKQGASSELEKLDFSTVTCKAAVNDIARIIYKLHDTVKDKELELEFSWICNDSKRQVQTVPAALAQQAIQLAKEAKQREEMEESDDEDEKDASAPTAGSASTEASDSTSSTTSST